MSKINNIVNDTVLITQNNSIDNKKIDKKSELIFDFSEKTEVKSGLKDLSTEELQSQKIKAYERLEALEKKRALVNGDKDLRKNELKKYLAIGVAVGAGIAATVCIVGGIGVATVGMAVAPVAKGITILGGVIGGVSSFIANKIVNSNREKNNIEIVKELDLLIQNTKQEINALEQELERRS